MLWPFELTILPRQGPSAATRAFVLFFSISPVGSHKTRNISALSTTMTGIWTDTKFLLVPSAKRLLRLLSASNANTNTRHLHVCILLCQISQLFGGGIVRA
ncbi:hypothetical protein BC830DRAFT_585824 [Chytriomyces sp. MP71]|nr:hypothetical protein BC830DRAFT_585824 [Chytriomyces sp. MP71]